MGHTYTRLLAHAVFSTKHRQPIIKPDFRDALYAYMAGIAEHEFGLAIQIGGTADHVHGLLLLRPDITISTAIGKWKSLSSGWVHKTIQGAEDFAWQVGYAAFSVSVSAEDTVRRYIQTQEEHHRTMTFEEELIALLKKHGVEYDARYLLD